MTRKKEYTEAEKTAFVELAQEQGLTPAMRILGYPNAWLTAKRWCDARGVKVDVDSLKSHAAATREWYTLDDKMLVIQEGLRRIYEQYVTNASLSADELRKLAGATKSLMETANLIEGKATTITKDSTDDDAFKALLDEFNKTSENREVS